MCFFSTDCGGGYDCGGGGEGMDLGGGGMDFGGGGMDFGGGGMGGGFDGTGGDFNCDLGNIEYTSGSEVLGEPCEDNVETVDETEVETGDNEDSIVEELEEIIDENGIKIKVPKMKKAKKATKNPGIRRQDWSAEIRNNNLKIANKLNRNNGARASPVTTNVRQATSGATGVQFKRYHEKEAPIVYRHVKPKSSTPTAQPIVLSTTKVGDGLYYVFWLILLQ